MEQKRRAWKHALRWCGYGADDSGATSTDYAMVVCGIALVIVTLVGSGMSPAVVFKRVGLVAEAMVSDKQEEVVVPAAAVSE